MRVLVVNAGSSSLKLSVVHGGSVSVQRELPARDGGFEREEIRSLLSEDGLSSVNAVGHRIVHGGNRFREAVVIDAEVRRALHELVELAPLHQPKSLEALEAVSQVLPEVPAVACFDTAFHATLPSAASTYALPQEWNRRWELRRYGFHGLSHAWIARRSPELLGASPEGLRIVSCHLGSGASACAIRDGMSVDTTMGFTPLEGLVMATRSGSVDPGLLLWLLQPGRLSADEITDGLEHHAGLAGLTGKSDMRAVLERAEAGEESACLGLDVYLHRLRAAIAAMTSALGGVDVLAFTGGVGEHAAEIRRRTVAGLAFLGLRLDQALNSEASGDAVVSAQSSRVAVLVVTAREDLEIARQVVSVPVRQLQPPRA